MDEICMACGWELVEAGESKCSACLAEEAEERKRLEWLTLTPAQRDARIRNAARLEG